MCLRTSRARHAQEDPTEHADLAASPAHAGTLARLQAQLETLNRGLFLPGRGEMSTQACLTGLSKGGYYGPFVDAEGYYTGPFPKRDAEQIAADEAYKEAMLFANTPPERERIVRDAVALFPWIGPGIQSKLDYCIAPNDGTLLGR